MISPLALVTSGATPLGIAIIQRLLDEGWKVALIDGEGACLADAENLLSDESAIVLSCDVTDEDELSEAFDHAFNNHGPITALINLTPSSSTKSLIQMNSEELRQLFEFNIVGPFNAVQAGLERMDRELAVVNIFEGHSPQSSYGGSLLSLSQAALKAMSETMARELAEQNVRVNTVALSLPVERLGVKKHTSLSSTAFQEHYRAAAAAVIYFLSEEAVTVSGQMMVVGE